MSTWNGKLTISYSISVELSDVNDCDLTRRFSVEMGEFFRELRRNKLGSLGSVEARFLLRKVLLSTCTKAKWNEKVNII